MTRRWRLDVSAQGWDVRILGGAPLPGRPSTTEVDLVVITPGGDVVDSADLTQPIVVRAWLFSQGVAVRAEGIRNDGSGGVRRQHVDIDVDASVSPRIDITLTTSPASRRWRRRSVARVVTAQATLPLASGAFTITAALG